MTIVPPFLSSRPWLLVWLVFFLMIAVWLVVFHLSSKVPTKRMTQQQEAALLQKGTMP